jgi:hypothetical protein
MSYYNPLFAAAALIASSCVPAALRSPRQPSATARRDDVSGWDWSARGAGQAEVGKKEGPPRWPLYESIH